MKENISMLEINKMTLSGSDWYILKDNGDVSFDPNIDKVLDTNYITATVPGNIQADLESAHLLKPLWYGLGDPRMEEVASSDWWYVKDFYISESFRNKRIKLIFGGVDHECQVYLNGNLLGKNSGMYKKFGFDISNTLLYTGSNRIAIKI